MELRTSSELRTRPDYFFAEHAGQIDIQGRSKEPPPVAPCRNPIDGPTMVDPTSGQLQCHGRPKIGMCTHEGETFSGTHSTMGLTHSQSKSAWATAQRAGGFERIAHSQQFSVFH